MLHRNEYIFESFLKECDRNTDKEAMSFHSPILGRLVGKKNEKEMQVDWYFIKPICKY